MFQISQNAKSIPLLDYDNVHFNKTETNAAKELIGINTSFSDIFVLNDIQTNFSNESYLPASNNNNCCFKCGKSGHWATDCQNTSHSHTNRVHIRPKIPRTRFSDNLSDRFLSMKKKKFLNFKIVILKTQIKQK